MAKAAALFVEKEKLTVEENRISAITKEKTDVLTDAYKETLEILDAYDHQTLTRR